MIMLGLGLGIALSYGQRNRSLVEGTEKRVSPLIKKKKKNSVQEGVPIFLIPFFCDLNVVIGGCDI